MTYPTVSPGVVSPPATALEQRLVTLEQRVDELSRRDLTNAIVGQGGTFRATLEADGIAVLEIGAGKPEYGSKQVVIMRDAQGAEVYHTDELAGYGLSAPIYSYLMVPIPGVGLTAGVESIVASSETFFYNPALYSKILLRAFTGVTSLQVRLVVTNGSTTITSSTQTITGPTFIDKIVLLPAEFMNAQRVTASWRVTPNVNGSVEGWPMLCSGLSRSSYDNAPGFQ